MREVSIFNQIPLNRVCGLEADASLCIGLGFVREEWKALCFKQGFAINDRAILNEKQLAEALVPESNGRVLEVSARVELLRESFRGEALRDALPLLSQYRFKPRFFEGLDRSLQQGRMLFAHAEEAQVLQERLNEKTGVDLKREEFFSLNRYWERLLEVREFWDDARLFEDAAQRVTDGLQGRTIYKLEHFIDLPRMKFFWEQFSRTNEVIRIHSSTLVDLPDAIHLGRKHAHSLEDEAHFLLDTIVKAISLDPDALDHHVVVIQDEPVIRRTLKRIAEQRGVFFQDPRDPTLIVQSEEIKMATLEMAMVSRGFPASLVLTWIGTQKNLKPHLGDLRKKIIEAGLVQGLDSYAIVPDVKLALSAVQARYTSRLTLSEVHQCIETSIQLLNLPIWVEAVFERVFGNWKKSFELLGLAQKKRPLRYWFEQVQEKLRRATPVSNPLKNKRGLRLFRVDQAVSALLLGQDSKTTVHFFGVSPSFFEPREEGNEWFSTRDREVLANEFGLPSYREAQVQAIQSFQTWAAIASDNHPIFWEHEYDEAGGETESCELNLGAIKGLSLGEKEGLGAHPSMLASLQTHLSERAQSVRVDLPKMEWPVSFMNAYGNCAFTAYAGFLLSLYDEREVDFDLKGDSFGNLVHSALEKMLLDQVSAADAFEYAWKDTRQLAWMKSERLYRSIRHKTLKLLETFQRSEAEYRSTSGAETAHLEYEIEWQKEGITFKGRIDRIDQHADGLVLIDYKTSSTTTSGHDTVEKGLGLQLPLYALAVKEKLNQDVVAAQYLQLSPEKINRHSGILFSKWNKSKKADVVEFPITHARSISRSLFTEEPETVWRAIDAKISGLLAQAKAGQFSPKPARPSDCLKCRYQVVCGRLRSGRAPTEEVEIHEES